MGCFVAFIITTKGCAVNASFLRISAQKKRKTPSGRLLREGKILMMADGKPPGRSQLLGGFSFWCTEWNILTIPSLVYAIPRKSQALHRKFTSLLLSFCKFLIYVLVAVHQLQRRGQHIVICCSLHGIRLVEITLHSSLSFFMPNSLRSKPLRHLGLLRTTTCIEPTTFRRLIRHYRRSAPGMFRFSSGSARPAPSPPPPARPFGWRW